MAKLKGAKKSVGIVRKVVPDVADPVTFFLKLSNQTFFKMRSSVWVINVGKVATKVVSVVST